MNNIPSVPLNPDSIVFTAFENAPSQRAPLPTPNPTKSFWLDSDALANPLARAGSTGLLPDAADVVIVGSGITGCSVAYHLAELLRRSRNDVKPVSAVILEARDFCELFEQTAADIHRLKLIATYRFWGDRKVTATCRRAAIFTCGTTCLGRNGGHLTAATMHDFRERMQLHGVDEALRDIELERHTVSSILEFLDRAPNAANEVDLVRGGHVTLLFTPGEVEAARADMTVAAEAGLDLTGVEWLQPEDTKQRFRVQLPGVFSPGHTLWPVKLVTKLFESAKGTKTPSSWSGRATSMFYRSTPPAFSLDLFTHAPVNVVNPVATDSMYRWLVKTDRGSVRARYIIHATNAYASHLLPHLVGPATGIVPTRAQCVATRGSVRANDWPTVGWGANEGYEYW
jgi:glycine/D-amino acid oxidase-like deaminating enzyme